MYIMVKDVSLARMAGNGDIPFHKFAVPIGSLDTNQERNIPEDDLDQIWVNLPMQLSRRYRERKRNGHSTDYLIEDLRNEHYGAFISANHFRMCIEELARRHSEEIVVDGDKIKVTKYGIDNYRRTDPSFQKDFNY